MSNRLQSSTIKSYISAIKSVLTRDGYVWNEDRVLLNVITKSCKVKNDRLTTRLPIQIRLLEIALCEVRKEFESQPYLEAMYMSAFLIGYYGLFRVGELTESPHVIKATNVHESKNDQQKLLIVLYSSKTHNAGSAPQKIRIRGIENLAVTNELKESYTVSETAEFIRKQTKSFQNTTYNCTSSKTVLPYKQNI